MLAAVPRMLEYEAGLGRAWHLHESGLSDNDVEVLLDALAAVAESVRLHFVWRPSLRDPGDEMVLETALNGGADCLATFNIRDFAAATGEFGLRVAPQGKFWRKITGGRHEKK
jgi:predicted nucleic acid-binding protein